MTPLSAIRRYLAIGNWSIRRKVLIGLLAIAVIPLLTFLVVDTYFRYLSTIEGAEVALARAARGGGVQIEHQIDTALHEVDSALQENALTQAATQLARLAYNFPGAPLATSAVDRLVNALDVQLNRHPDFQAIRLLGADGHLLAQTGLADHLSSILAGDQRQHPAYLALSTEALEPDHAHLLGPYPDPETQAIALEAGSLVVEDNTLLGYLIVTLDADRLLEQPLAQVTGENESAADYVFLLDDAGWLLTSVQGAAPFTRQPHLASVTGEEEEGPALQFYERDWGGGPRLVMGRHYTLEGLGWTAVAEIEQVAIVQPLVAALIRSSLPTLLVALAVVIGLLVVFHRMLVRPIVHLTAAARQIAGGNLEVVVSSAAQPARADEIGLLAEAIATMTEHLRHSIHNLEARVRERTRELELTTTIIRQASTLQDIQGMLDHTVNLIVEHFPQIYHAQVFLVDEAGEQAILVSSTGEAGRELLRRGHRLPVGSVSVIGRVTELGQSVVARDTSTSRIHRHNEFLPETRAEMAVPLMIGDQILGALDLQSKSPDAFTPEEQGVADTLAGQLAIAISNARLYQDLRQQAEEATKLNRLLTRTAWEEILTAARRQGRVEAVAGPAAGEDKPDSWGYWQAEAARQRRLVISPPEEDGQRTLAAPIIVRGEVLGVIDWRVPAGQVNDNTLQTAEELASRLAITLETIRLLEHSERLAERERLVNRITGQLTAEPNVALILETAVQELAAILQTPNVSIQLKRPNGAPPTGRTESA